MHWKPEPELIFLPLRLSVCVCARVHRKPKLELIFLPLRLISFLSILISNIELHVAVNLLSCIENSILSALWLEVIVAGYGLDIFIAQGC